jgi:hypothetical protein
MKGEKRKKKNQDLISALERNTKAQLEVAEELKRVRSSKPKPGQPEGSTEMRS